MLYEVITNPEGDEHLSDASGVLLLAILPREVAGVIDIAALETEGADPAQDARALALELKKRNNFV